MKSRALPVVVAIAIALTAAAIASAAAIQQGSGKLLLQPGVEGSVKAKCKQPNRKGTPKASLVGSGFRGTGFAVANHGMVPKGKSVKGTAANDGAKPAKATIRAYCARGIETEIKSVTDSFTPMATHNFFVKCGKGEKALSGGWHAVGTAPQFWTVQNSLRQGSRSWVVSAAASEAGQLKVYVVCTPDPVDLIARKGPKTQTAAGTVVTSTAKCPTGTLASGGGFGTGVDEGTPYSSVAAPVASLRKGNRTWQSRGYAELTKPGQYIQAHVVCLNQAAG
jgi:hypothetical protein